MTLIPRYLSDYPNVHSAFPFHLSINHVDNYFPAHRHDFLEFSLVLEGEGSETINGKTHPLSPGTFTFVSPYQIHDIHTYTDHPLILYNCNFDLELIMDSGQKDHGLTRLLYNGMDAEERPSFIQLDQDQFPPFKAILDNIYQEYQSKAPWRNLLIKAKVIELLIHFDRLRQEENSLSKVTTKQANGMIWPIVHYIHSHFNEDITLSRLSDLFKVSVPYLSEQFKRQVGLNFINFLHEVRIRHACSLLLSTDMPVTDIAAEVGYQSFNTFSRVFRQRKRLTPTAYRRAAPLEEPYTKS
ncbi:hypothetical protein GCM10011391_06100 [Pullulanibacillus camelliae]|uniref:HTH araC/xylS-type domain-containing protein n=1 Tax=Pullulanibacillus camelliae TaxID=1707096 RepID=A0A8J2VLN6_9BACL|nr:AraC family transcriptional regulator [Pullulanibacillus camelliae]GGE30301.1 hypothetical protein GCM10011391_06100 [Pullulanibacillus camelliae]